MEKFKHQALWRDLTPSPSFSSLSGRIKVDTAIVGAGITGVTAAWHLARAGQKVALIDMGHVGSGETGKTTSHLTFLPDGGAVALRKKHGDAAAAQVLMAQREALDAIATRCDTFGAKTRFRRVPGYLYCEAAHDAGQIDDDRAALLALGMQAEHLPSVPLPFSTAAALRVEAQAQFEPMAYLTAMCQDIQHAQGQIFTDSRVEHVQDGTPCQLRTSDGEIEATHLILATHTPPNRLAYHTQIFAYRTYALAARCAVLPPPGLYFDTADPYHYIRTQDTSDGELLIVGGNDHKTGKDDANAAPLAQLAGFTKAHFEVKSIDYAWSGQIMEPADGLPFVGFNGFDKHTLFASGYSGNGITLGTVAAEILADTVLGREHRHVALFSSRRSDIAAQLGSIVKENVDVPVHMLGDRVAALTRSDDDIKPGEGRVVQRGAHAVAMYCDDQGQRHACSAVCPHMGCLVAWNAGETTWDCPCHGSRFSAKGELINGPALEDLKAV